MYDLLQAHCTQNNRSRSKCPLRRAKLAEVGGPKKNKAQFYQINVLVAQFAPAALGSSRIVSSYVGRRLDSS